MVYQNYLKHWNKNFARIEKMHDIYFVKYIT